MWRVLLTAGAAALASLILLPAFFIGFRAGGPGDWLGPMILAAQVVVPALVLFAHRWARRARTEIRESDGALGGWLHLRLARALGVGAILLWVAPWAVLFGVQQWQRYHDLSEWSTAEVIGRLQTGGPAGRRSAAQELGRRRVPSARGALAAACADPDLEVRKAACWALGDLRLNEPAIVQALIACLQGGDADSRRAAAWALANLHPPPPAAIPELERLLLDPVEFDAGRDALLKFWGEALPSFVRALGSEHPQVRAAGWNGANILLARLPVADGRFRRLPEAVVAEWRDGHARLRRGIAWFCAVHAPLLTGEQPLIDEAAGAADGSTRLAAAVWYARAHSGGTDRDRARAIAQSIDGELLQFVPEEAEHARLVCLESLPAFASAGRIDRAALLQLAEDPQTGHAVARVIAALGGKPGDVPALRAILRDGAGDLRPSVVRALIAAGAGDDALAAEVAAEIRRFKAADALHDHFMQINQLIDVLEELRQPAGAAALVDLLEEVMFRTSASVAIRDIGSAPPAVVSRLAEFVRENASMEPAQVEGNETVKTISGNERGMLRAAAAMALCGVVKDPQGAIAVIREALADICPEVREQLLQALAFQSVHREAYRAELERIAAEGDAGTSAMARRIIDRHLKRGAK